MLRSTFILALAGFATATGLNGKSGRKAPQASIPLPRDSQDLSFTPRSYGCDTLETECDGYCIPSGSSCCDHGNGDYCDLGDVCKANGCCPIGKTCTDYPTGCNAGKKLCGDYCIPKGSVCCGKSGVYCDAGETCTGDGMCEGGGSDSTLTGGFPEPSFSLSTAAEPTDYQTTATATTNDIVTESTATDDSFTESTATDSSPTTTESSSLCRRKSHHIHFGGGHHHHSGDDDDDCGAANGLVVPAALAGVAAVVPLFL